jgi:hypothetical protein
VIANNLLRSLQPYDFALISPGLREWSAQKGTDLYQPGDTVKYVYFPCRHTLLSLRVVLDDGSAVETAMIGREGACQGIISQGDVPSYVLASVQIGGPFLRIEAAVLEQAKARSRNIQFMFERYAECLLAQVYQSVACNAAHSIEQRTAKWLLATVDRTGDYVVPLTQEQLASMLSVGRSYVTRVIQALRNKQVLDTKRGAIIIRDAEGLKSMACSCNTQVKRHFDAVLAGVYPNGAKGSENVA